MLKLSRISLAVSAEVDLSGAWRGWRVILELRFTARPPAFYEEPESPSTSDLGRIFIIYFWRSDQSYVRHRKILRDWYYWNIFTSMSLAHGEKIVEKWKSHSYNHKKPKSQNAKSKSRLARLVGIPPPLTTTFNLLSCFSARCGQIWACDQCAWGHILIILYMSALRTMKGGIT